MAFGLALCLALHAAFVQNFQRYFVKGSVVSVESDKSKSKN